MDEELLPTLQRYIDEYEWGWPLTRRLINRTFHFDYTVEQLQIIYRTIPPGCIPEQKGDHHEG